MRRFVAAVLAVSLGVLGMAGCAKTEQTYQDGVYTAEYKEFDGYGYKDYIEVTIKNGTVTNIVYDGRDEDGNLKTEDEKYRSEMEAVRDTYPQKYTADLVNQMLEKQDINSVDALAGASYSSESFKTLFVALEPQIYEGNTDLLLVDNIQDK